MPLVGLNLIAATIICYGRLSWEQPNRRRGRLFFKSMMTGQPGRVGHCVHFLPKTLSSRYCAQNQKDWWWYKRQNSAALFVHYGFILYEQPEVGFRLIPRFWPATINNSL
jgi:hypothetical protein